MPLGHSFDPIFVTWLITIGLIIAGVVALIVLVIWGVKKGLEGKTLQGKETYYQSAVIILSRLLGS